MNNVHYTLYVMYTVHCTLNIIHRTIKRIAVAHLVSEMVTAFHEISPRYNIYLPFVYKNSRDGHIDIAANHCLSGLFFLLLLLLIQSSR